MTPAQISLVTTMMAELDVEAVTIEFYRRAFQRDPEVASMFTSDPAVQRARFAAELTEIVRSIGSIDEFESTVHALGERHRGYGVCAAHYSLMGQALLESLAAVAQGWDAETAEAWSLAYNLTAESMMLGALNDSATHPRQ